MTPSTYSNTLFDLSAIPAWKAAQVEGEILDAVRARVPLPYPSAKAFYAAIKREIRRRGYKPVRAHWDAAGNCLICGECGRCPGWHIERK